MKQMLALILVVTVLLSLTACGAPKSTSEAMEVPSTVESSESTPASNLEIPVSVPVQKTAVQAQAVRYIPIAEVGTYNTKIITPELLSACTLPNVDKAALPYWTGYILENKISVNYGVSDEWEQYTAGGWYYNEDEIRYLAENGFNCVRVVYSLSFLSNPEDVYSINVSELEQLDELISWCTKYNVHLMLSQTGLPGKWGSWGDNWHLDFDMWNSEENVGNNTELFTSPEMQQVYTAYWDMLAKRYAEIPNSLLSFELAAEQSVPDGDMQLQADVLGPVAKTIWASNPDRIVIVNDVCRQAPSQLAKLGCCISLHNHFYSLGDLSWCGFPNTDQKWPMQYLPFCVNENSGVFSLESESSFSAGELKLYYQYYNFLPIIKGDGQVLYQPEYGNPCYEQGSLSVEIPQGVKRLEISFPSEMGLAGVILNQDGKETLTLPSHANGQCLPVGKPMPSLLIHDDLTVEDISEVKHPLDVSYFTENYLQSFIDCAKENGVSFLMTEVGTDQAAHLSPEEYVAYEETWLTALKNNNVGWMFNCVHNTLAPEPLLWLNAVNTDFSEFSNVQDMYGYTVNDTVMNMLKRFQ